LKQIISALSFNVTLNFVSCVKQTIYQLRS